MNTSTIKSGIEDMTPMRAADILKTKAPNRNLREDVVEIYKGAILRGEWRLNGEPVIINDMGQLIDGQHRLAAIVKAGVIVTLFVVRGVAGDRSTMDTIDIGARRLIQDQYKLDGEKHANTLTAAMRWLYKYEQHQMQTQTARPTKAQLDSLLQVHPAIRDSVEFVVNSKANRLASGAALSFAHYVGSVTQCREAADYFFGKLGNGEGLDADSPILSLRNRLITIARSRSRTPTVDVLAITIKTWNSFIEDRQIKALKFMAKARKDGDAPEAFPGFTGHQFNSTQFRQRLQNEMASEVVAQGV